MPAHPLKFVQQIPATIHEVWEFFSDPRNLPVITPVEMKFAIISQHHGDTMYSGQIIEYFVSPIAGIKLYWMTEITHVEHLKFFIDEQRYGPYAMWHHQHHFVEIDGGVQMTDIIHYKNPFGILGSALNNLIVRPRLNNIFQYRYNKTEEIFGKWK